ncbi:MULTISPECIES: nitrate reductase [unclassified Bosea (in: a-proteobacteria)]|uniref:nitrate reductase n=1 Tax=unclassified Bosea (in: a-proteobacteria) TaxID=2653178 RepID=UPI000F763F90|nr:MULTISPECIES: nitrate reductase [unclassified Bosea (in: a-proteobacteria)]AZO77675.1 nitrate reductase [Bosea sp. Tri-49]RXT18287.1 nitrate reductase [Bosea sp. Tri-39]RXT32883.1 nitrate reductase [Bosea sp. Tri-54]
MRHDAPLAAVAATRTTCPYCGVGCGVLATPDGKGGATIAGDPDHPANRGRLCSKGSALGETLGLGTRVLHPLKRSARGAYTQISWDEALDAVAAGFWRVIDRHGPEAVAFYLSGQLLTEDYYVANKLMKGFIGSPHVDTNSRLCMASTVAGHRRVLGSDTVPGNYEDLDSADLIVLVGSNAAWCHPVLFRRIQQNRSDRSARVVVIDPRITATAEDADLVLPLKPGSDSVLFAGLLVHLADAGLIDRAYVERHVAGFDAALANAREIAPDLAAVAALTGLPESDISSFYALWAGTPAVVTAWSQGVNQSAQGTDKVAAILHCHLATGRIGQPGSGPFSLTGQPNAMGGREVGGLANMLAAHMGYSPAEVDRVRRFWGAPRMAQAEGLKAVAMMDAVADGRIKAMWVMATNPAVSLPRADAVQAALRGLDLFVVSENVLSNDTLAAGPDFILPAAAWGEKDGTVTNSERRISRQRAFLPLPGEVRPDWWIVCEVAKRLGFSEAFAYAGPHQIYAEHAAISAFENEGSRDFDIGAHADLTRHAYDGLAPVQWPVPVGKPEGTARLFAEGGFFTADRKAKMQPLATPTLAAATSEAFPLLLNTGRVRDHWHTMTRTGLSARLSAHIAEPTVLLHPEDAARYSLADKGFARIATAHGAVVLKVALDPGAQPGSLFAPIHWSAENASDARIGAAVQPFVDPFSGQPEMKATPAAIAPVSFRSRGFLLGGDGFVLPEGSWWTRVAVESGQGRLFATQVDAAEIMQLAREAFGPEGLLEMVDAERGLYRCALIRDGRLAAALFLGPDHDAPVWDAVKLAFAGGEVDPRQRLALLSGRSLDGAADQGPTVCACFGVGLNAIRAVFAEGAAITVEDIGRKLKAGTNCGSCLPEIRRIGAQQRVEVPA